MLFLRGYFGFEAKITVNTIAVKKPLIPILRQCVKVKQS
jgi:hypothetical protein